ncbi:MAG: histidine kinase [Lachnospiraceae bacterium]|nr:histidine kinase [Lachnospiraceae bacterium]
MERNKNLISKTYRMLFFIALLIFIASLSILYYVRNALSSQVVNSALANITKENSDMNAKCSRINYVLLDMFSSNDNISAINNSESLFVRNAAIVNLYKEFSNMRSDYLGEYNFFFFNEESDIFVMPTLIRGEYTSTLTYRQAILNYIKQNQPQNSARNNKWTLLKISDEEYILIKVHSNGDYYIGSWIDLLDVYSNFGVNDYSSVGNYMFFVQGSEVITLQDVYSSLTGLASCPLNFAERSRTFGNYEMVRFDVFYGDFSLVFIINVLERYRSLQIILVILLGILMTVLIVGVMLLIYINNRLLNPLNDFVENMSLEQINNKKPYFEEVSKVYQLFTNVQNQVEKLKIEMYENEIARQQIEMEYLQQQIKPHFYLNCMNIIYSMAQMGQISGIQKLSMEISNYFRSMFQKGNRLVPLRDELDHVQRYLKINEIRYEDEFEYEISVPDEIMHYRIPPLMIHTFVENTFKYATTGTTLLKILIKAWTASEKQHKYLIIEVRDNGFGFEQMLLEQLNQGKDMGIGSGEKIGLQNTRKRLQFYYHERAKILFFNEEGAVVRVWIPIEEGDSN